MTQGELIRQRKFAGLYIKHAMKELNLNITKVAELSGCSREQVGWVLYGKRQPTFSTVLKIANVCGLKDIKFKI